MPALGLLTAHASLPQSLQGPPISLGGKTTVFTKMSMAHTLSSLGTSLFCLVWWVPHLSAPSTLASSLPQKDHAATCPCHSHHPPSTTITGTRMHACPHSSDFTSSIRPFLIPPIWVRVLCYLLSWHHFSFFKALSLYLYISGIIWWTFISLINSVRTNLWLLAYISL